MNPILINAGFVQIRAFTLLIMIGVAVSAALIVWQTKRQTRAGSSELRVLDTVIGAVALGIVGARAGHVLLHLDYFSVHTDEITRLSAGGLNWHGAVIGGILGAVIAARIRRVPLAPLFDGAALALPLFGAFVWLACAAAGAAYGIEVRSLADYPAWIVTESPDIYGTVAPRLNLYTPGVALCIGVLIVMAILTLFRLIRGLRFPLALALLALGMSVIDTFRAETVPMLFDRRADQVLDYIIALLAIMWLIGQAAFVGFRQLRQHSQDTQPIRVKG
jgi:phosphatidylglycerol---prolipoprotein diacylglyceryl transferase